MSEFGRGYATCLRQFANHAARRDHWAKLATVLSDTEAVEMWANGASDHFYQLVRPRRGVPRSEWTAAQHVASRALDIGHGFRPTSRSSWEEIGTLLDATNDLLSRLTDRGHSVATLDEAMATDVVLGLRPERGDWSCALDLVPRS